MTWDELAKYISDMSEQDRVREVLYREPWADDADIYPLFIHECTGPLSSLDGKIRLDKGELFLQ